MTDVISIALVKPSKSYAPEILAYYDYFSNTPGFSCSIVEEDEAPSIDVDVLLVMAGIVPFYKKIKAKYLILDYASLSTGVAPRIKNLIKRIVNKKSHINICLNQHVKAGFFLNDSTLIRDMGADASFFESNGSSSKRESCVYCGSINKARGSESLIDSFVGSDLELFLIGDVDDHFKSKYSNHDNIIFLGSMRRDEICEELKKHTYGINYVPDVYPYNIQTSTKVIEYSASGLKIISNKYSWISEFEKKSNSNYLYFDFKKTIERNDLIDFDFYTNSKGLSWQEIIENSKIKDKILEVYYNGRIK